MNPTKKRPVIPCGVAVIRRGREFLISQRNKDDTLGSYWEFPGGRKNPGETFEQCVVRESKEELGIRVAVEGKLMDVRREYADHVIWLNFFMCSHVSGEPQPLESQQVLWTDVERLSTFNFPPANEPVIEKLVKRYASKPDPAKA